jgi:hypothetical protein
MAAWAFMVAGLFLFGALVTWASLALVENSTDPGHRALPRLLLALAVLSALVGVWLHFQLP